METYDYYGWHVSIEDIMYRNLLKENANIIDADKDKLVKIIKKHVKNSTTALDIGCHYGFMTQLLCRHFNTVHAFDFNNDVFECFLKNAQKFNLSNVVPHPYGLGDSNRKVATKDWFAKIGRRGPLGNHVDMQGTKKDQHIKTLDSLKIRDVGLMLIDTEGFELMVLQGADQTIRKYSPVIILECHSKKELTRKFGYKKEAIMVHMIQLGYKNKGLINRSDILFVKE